MTDPIGDMLTRIRNASRAHHVEVVVPASQLREHVAQVLKDEGYIKDYVRHKDSVQGSITVLLKYGPAGEAVITDISRISRPGLRRYVQAAKIPRIRNGMGISILSTSHSAPRWCRSPGTRCRCSILPASCRSTSTPAPRPGFSTSPIWGRCGSPVRTQRERSKRSSPAT